MCCCGKPTINGMSGAYSWDGKTFSTRPVQPPDLNSGDSLICDEPGRCGNSDAHSHHFRLVRTQYGELYLLVRHGGGDERISLGPAARAIIPDIESLGSNARFWLLHTIYSVHEHAENSARNRQNAIWRRAAAERRIKVRKVRGRDAVKVSIEKMP